MSVGPSRRLPRPSVTLYLRVARLTRCAVDKGADSADAVTYLCLDTAAITFVPVLQNTRFRHNLEISQLMVCGSIDE